LNNKFRNSVGIHETNYHCTENGYLRILPMLFDLSVGNFYLQFSRETNREEILICIHKYFHPWQRIFIGVTDPSNPTIETPEQICELILQAAKYIPVEQLGTTDDCGFAPFADDRSVSKYIALRKNQSTY